MTEAIIQEKYNQDYQNYQYNKDHVSHENNKQSQSLKNLITEDINIKEALQQLLIPQKKESQLQNKFGQHILSDIQITQKQIKLEYINEKSNQNQQNLNDNDNDNKQKNQHSNNQINLLTEERAKSAKTKKTLNLSKGFQPAELKSLQKPSSFYHQRPSSVINFQIQNGKKIFMSEDEIIKLKKLKVQNKKREYKIKQKILLHEQMQKDIKKNQIQIEQKRTIQSIEKRKQKIKAKQDSLSNQKQQKALRLDEENLKLKELKNKIKLYQKMQNDFKKKQQKLLDEQTRLKPPQINPIVIDFQKIKSDGRQYISRSRQSIRKSRQKIKIQLMDIQQQFKSLNLYKSQFYENVKKQQKQKIEQIEQIPRIKRANSLKIKQYKDSVRQSFLPKILKPQIIVQKKKIKSKDNKQLYILGNQYMNQYKESLDRQRALTQKQRRRDDFQINLRSPMKKKQKRRFYTQGKQNIDQNNLNINENRKKHQLLAQIKRPSDSKQRYDKLHILHNRIGKQLKPNQQKGIKLKLTQDIDANANK